MSDRHGALQPDRFDPARAHKLDDPERERWLPSQEIVRLLELPSPCALLDYGTGTGVLALAVARARPDVEVYALDEQREMLGHVEQKLMVSPAANVRVIAPHQAKSLRGVFQRVLAVNVLHEVGDAALAEMIEFCRDDGMLLVVDWDRAVDRPVGPPPGHVYAAAAARERLAAAGLEAAPVGSFSYHFAFRCVKNSSVAR